MRQLASTVSVVIPTYQRQDLLSRCLSALVQQHFRGSRYEICVVEDGHSFSAKEVVESRAQASKIPIHYLALGSKKGPAAARNLGWRKAKGEIIAFTDDDTVPDLHWLSYGIAAFGENVIAVRGRVKVPVSIMPTDYEKNEAQLEGAEFVTANCFLRREVLSAIGGFDERFETAWREDSDLYFNLLKYSQDLFPKAEIVVEPKALVLHPVRAASWGVSLVQQKKTLYNALLYKKHPRLFREKIQTGPPWNYYLSLFAVAFAVVSGAQGHSSAMKAGMILWALLTLGFCYKRLKHTTRSAPHIFEMIVTSILIPPLSVFWRLRGALRYRVFYL